MFNRCKDNTLQKKWAGTTQSFLTSAIILALVVASVQMHDQQSQTPAAQTPDNGKPKQEAPSEAGGPTDSVGPYAIPKKKAEDAPPPPPPVAPKKLEDIPDYSLKVN